MVKKKELLNTPNPKTYADRLTDMNSLNDYIPGFNKSTSLTGQISQALSLSGENKDKAKFYIANELGLVIKSPDGKSGALVTSQSNLENIMRLYTPGFNN